MTLPRPPITVAWRLDQAPPASVTDAEGVQQEGPVFGQHGAGVLHNDVEDQVGPPQANKPHGEGDGKEKA